MQSNLPIQLPTPAEVRVGKNIFRAAKDDGLKPFYLHMNGEQLTRHSFWAWTGTPSQFDNLKKQDAELCKDLCLIPLLRLAEPRTFYHGRCSAEEIFA